MADKSNKRIRTDKLSTEWAYAKECWDALARGEEVPPIPVYRIYESYEGVGKDKLIGTKPIDPKRVTRQGVTVYG